MRHVVLSCSLALLAACAKGEQEPAPDTTAVGMEPAAAPTISLADLAGRWDVTSTPESGSDMTPTRYTLTATSDMTGWSITFPDRPEPVALRVVSVDGDSVVTEAGPFESVRRKGVQVTTRGVLRLAGDRLVGSTRARYETTGADTVLILRTEGVRAQ